MRHIVGVADFTAEDIRGIFDRAKHHKREGKCPSRQPLTGKRLATLFYEPSTRTRLSFEAAMQMLGGTVISTENAKHFSSTAKGERVEDTVRIVSGYADAIVLRHDVAGAAARAAPFALIPLINAGDGENEHPSQALTDLFTIWEACESGRIGERKILRVHFYGDNYKSRVVRSLVVLLGKHAETLGLGVSNLYFGGPYKECAQPDEALYDEVANLYRSFVISNSGLGTPAHVVYLTRVQRERYSKDYRFTREEPPGSPEASHWEPTFGKKHAVVMGHDSIVMHPFPRLDELSPEVDSHPCAAYFEQAQNGLYVRMALLEHLLK